MRAAAPWLDGENARHFRDDFLEIELRADRIIWFASANDVSGLPASILDRVHVLEIPTLINASYG